MKEIKAVIQPRRLQRVREALRRIPGFPGMTVTRAEGAGYHPGAAPAPGIRSELTEYSPRIRIEIVAADEAVDAIVAAIRQAAHTGLAGDGVLWVSAAERFVRLREPAPPAR